MVRYLNQFVNRTVVTIPKADHIFDTTSNNLVCGCFINTSYITFMLAVYFFAIKYS